MDNIPVVVIAASAGGLGPIGEILDGYPAGFAAATVVIQHLSPDHRSELVRLLAAHTEQPVVEIAEGTPLVAGQVHVIQPGTQILLEGNTFAALAKDRYVRPYFTIDVFLESLAARAAPLRAAAVVLSGTGTDATQGCRALVAAGGYVVVQDLQGVKFDGMPSSVVHAGAFHETQPTSMIPARLAAWLEGGCTVPPPMPVLDADTVPGAMPTLAGDGVGHPYGEIFAIVRRTYDVDLDEYKIATIDRRIANRMRRLGIDSIAAYAAVLAASTGELQTLFTELMIGVTSFFRTIEMFRRLNDSVLPERVRDSDGPLKVWVCGCSTGEEAYSVAMVLDRVVRETRPDLDYKIFATDISLDAIRRASAGEYDAAALMPLIEEFGLHDAVTGPNHLGRVRVSEAVRRRIVFSVQNVLRHSPFKGLDLVLCRNLLIYLRPQAQRKVITNFHFGLKDGALLVLGESENTAGLEAYFQEIDPRLRIYAKRSDLPLGPQERLSLNRAVGAPLPAGGASGTRRSGVVLSGGVVGSTHQARSLFEAAFAQLAGDALLVAGSGELLYVSGRAGLLLERTIVGRPVPTLDAQVGDEALLATLHLAMAEARRRGAPVEVAYAWRRGELAFERVRVRPLDVRLTQDAVVLVELLGAAPAPGAGASAAAPASDAAAASDAPAPAAATAATTAKDLLDALGASGLGVTRYLELERENNELRRMVDEAVQDRQTFNEELQNTNEELLAGNEELQSTNEELQSVNEELHSLNAEFELKLRQLSEAHSDISNLLTVTDVALVLLDRQMRVRRFTQGATQHIPLGPGDLGRRVDELASRVSQAIVANAGPTLESGAVQPLEVAVGERRWVALTLLPYRDHAQRIEGLVASVTDISALRNAVDELTRHGVKHEMMDRLVGVGFWDWPDLEADAAVLSPSLARRIGRASDDVLTTVRDRLADVHPDDRERAERALEGIRDHGRPFTMEIRSRNGQGRWMWVLTSGTPYVTPEGKRGLLVSSLDIDDRKRAEVALAEERDRQAHDDRLSSLGVLASGMAHELNNPLAAIRLGAEQMRRIVQSWPASDDGGEPSAQRAIFTRIVERQLGCVERMKSIIDSLLAHSRAHADADLRTTAHVGDILRDVEQLTRPLAAEHGVALHVEPAASQLVLHCHPIEISQVLINLVSNAVAAVAPLPERWVRVSAAAEGAQVVLRVVDAGRTAAIVQPARLFTPFHTTKGVGKGTGLGLSLSRRIVESHGGTLELDAGAEHTTFVARLPSPG